MFKGGGIKAGEFRMIKVILNTKSNPALRSLDYISNKTKAGIRQAFYQAGKSLKSTSSNLILDKNKSGILYTVRLGNSKRKHQASAPGEAPANLTGNLRKSIGFDVRGSEQLEFGSRDGAPAAGVSGKQHVAKYSVFLELGTSRMAARPFLNPSIESNERNIFTSLVEQIKGSLNAK